MRDLDRIMGRQKERDAIVIWNGEIAITVAPLEFPRMKSIIERMGEGNFDDDDNGSFGVRSSVKLTHLLASNFDLIRQSIG